MNDVYQINLAKTEFREAYNSGNVLQVLSVFAPAGFTDMSEGLPSKYGHEAISVLQERTEKLFEEYAVKLSIIIIDIVVLGGTAHDFGWHEWTLTPRTGGAPIRKRERYFELWARDTTAGWKIALWMNNSDVAEELNGSRSRWFMAGEKLLQPPSKLQSA